MQWYISSLKHHYCLPFYIVTKIVFMILMYIFKCIEKTKISICDLCEELNASDEEGNTPLHWAVKGTQRESCACLLDLGADSNILNLRLMSPLHLAVSLGHNPLVEVRPLPDPPIQLYSSTGVFTCFLLKDPRPIKG